MSKKVKEVKPFKSSESFKRFQAQLKKDQEIYRENPDKLAAAILLSLKRDNHPNEDPTTYSNGAMHWYQKAWGIVHVKKGKFKKLESPVTNWSGDAVQNDWWEVKCPTTGCIAGTADVLAGYPMVFQHTISDYYKELYPNKSDVDFIIEHSGEDYQLSVDDCYDPIRKKVRGIREVAAELLVLEGEQWDWLFSADRSIQEVTWGLEQIAAGRYDWSPHEYYGDREYDSETGEYIEV